MIHAAIIPLLAGSNTAIIDLRNITVPFSSLGLAPALTSILVERQYKQPYPIQQQAIPSILTGKDLMGIAPTGSGKTAAYVLPILSVLQSATKLKNRHIQVLVLVPTRELATQVQEVTLTFSRMLPTPVKSLAVFGGVSINPQMIGMQGVQMLIATPGRLLDLIDSKALSLDSVQQLVVDEADKMLNMGFKEEMDRILGMLPSKRQNLLFSATLNPSIEELARLHLSEPEVIQVEAKEDEIELITQRAYAVSPIVKGPFLRKLIIAENMQQVLVFTSSKRRADHVAEKLSKNGINARSIHGDKSMGSRTSALSEFKSGDLKVLVTTDLLARGIDIEFLPYVINYELPRSPKDFIHRIGRTGRAENPGVAISLITPEEEHHFKVIQKKMKTRVELESADLI